MLTYILTALIASLIVILFVGAFKPRRYWRNFDIASTSPITIFGDTLSSTFAVKNIAFDINRIYNLFPNENVVGFYEFNRPSLLIRDPQLIGAVLVSNFHHFHDRTMHKLDSSRLGQHLFALNGKKWQIVRRSVSSMFSPNRLRSLVTIIDRCNDILEFHLRNISIKNEPIEMNELMSKYIMCMIGCTAFGWRLNTLQDLDMESKKIRKVLAAQNKRRNLMKIIRFLWPNLPSRFKLSASSSKFEQYLVNSLRRSEECRKNESIGRNDFVQMMLDIRDHKIAEINRNVPRPVFDDDIILSNMLIFYLAGFESLSAVLAFLLYELALHPHIQQRLRKEIQNVLNIRGNRLSFECLRTMTYLEMVICEALRKYSPATYTSRVCTKKYHVPKSSLILSEGMHVYVPIYSLQHDERYFPNPTKFNPERFKPENLSSIPPFTFLPFGSGPRMCIGFQLAKMKMKLCLGRLISKYKFEMSAKTEIPSQIEPQSIIFREKNRIWLQILKLEES